MNAKMVKIGANGRFVIPAEFRNHLQVKDGDELLVRLVDDELRISTPEVAIRRAQEIVRRHVPVDRSLVDELISERRDAAARE